MFNRIIYGKISEVNLRRIKLKLNGDVQIKASYKEVFEFLTSPYEVVKCFPKGRITDAQNSIYFIAGNFNIPFSFSYSGEFYYDSVNEDVIESTIKLNMLGGNVLINLLMNIKRVKDNITNVEWQGQFNHDDKISYLGEKLMLSGIQRTIKGAIKCIKKKVEKKA